MNKPTQEELKTNEYIGVWDNADENVKKALTNIYSNSKSNLVRYNCLIEVTTWDNKDINNLKRVIAFYYDKDRDFYNYAMNRLKEGIINSEKPKCALIGRDGNIFYLMGIASDALIKNNMQEESDEMVERVANAQNYSKALSIIAQYVDVTDVLELNEEEEY